MRLIDVDEAIINFGFEWDDIPPTREEFVRFLKKQSTVDAVPVVRCRECMYWQSGENQSEKWEYCTFHKIEIGPHSFCSYGKRKEGAD